MQDLASEDRKLIRTLANDMVRKLGARDPRIAQAFQPFNQLKNWPDDKLPMLWAQLQALAAPETGAAS